MKALSLLSVLLLGVSINAYADQDKSSHAQAAKKSAHVIHLADASNTNNALRLKFVSRRAVQNPAVKNKDAYKADDDWVGATYVEKRESKAAKRLNRQFRSKRPHINYQFD